MKTLTSNHRLFAMLVVASCAFAPAGAAGLASDGKVRMPDLSALARGDTAIVGVSMRLDCVGVASIENLPDQWNATLTVDGESNTIVLGAFARDELLADDAVDKRRQTNDALEKIRIALHWRGEWSDCAGWDVFAEGMRRARDGSWATVRQSFSGNGIGEWKAGAVTGAEP